MKREKIIPGVEISETAKTRIIHIYNHVIEAILDIHEAKKLGGIAKSTVLDEPLKQLYKAKARLWGISQGRLRKPIYKKHVRYKEVVEYLFESDVLDY